MSGKTNSILVLLALSNPDKVLVYIPRGMSQNNQHSTCQINKYTVLAKSSLILFLNRYGWHRTPDTGTRVPTCRRPHS